jgi:Kef-type K+ transport system membrane component KefB
MNALWPLVLGTAWAVGEMAFRVFRVPRLTSYAVTGFALGSTQLGVLPSTTLSIIPWLADLAFGLILFETGFGLHLRWLRVNPWIALTSVAEAGLTFVVVAAIASASGLPRTTALLVATLLMATSPATVLRVIRDRRSTGQVSERALYLSAIDCTMAVFLFKVVVGLSVASSLTTGAVVAAMQDVALVLAASASLGIAVGVLLPGLLRVLRPSGPDATVATALGIIALVAICRETGLSPVLAALVCGVVARHRRLVFDGTRLDFGVFGELLAVLLFVYVSSTLEWPHLKAGLGLAAVLLVARWGTKSAAIVACARVSGTTWRKGFWTGVAMTPMSAFVILMLEQTRALGIDLIDRTAPLGAAALLVEIVGPAIVGFAVRSAGETATPLES